MLVLVPALLVSSSSLVALNQTSDYSTQATGSRVVEFQHCYRGYQSLLRVTAMALEELVESTGLIRMSESGTQTADLVTCWFPSSIQVWALSATPHVSPFPFWAGQSCRLSPARRMIPSRCAYGQGSGCQALLSLRCVWGDPGVSCQVIYIYIYMYISNLYSYIYIYIYICLREASGFCIFFRHACDARSLSWAGTLCWFHPARPGQSQNTLRNGFRSHTHVFLFSPPRLGIQNPLKESK